MNLEISTIQYPDAVQQYAPKPAFDRFWHWVRQRHMIYENRRANRPAPWCEDDYINTHKFCNLFRELDKESQFVIKLANDEVSQQSFDRAFFRIMLFRIWNLKSTWDLIENHCGPIDLDTFDFIKASKAIDTLPPNGKKKDFGFSGAYNPRGIPEGRYVKEGWERVTGHKTAEYHFRSIVKMIDEGLPTKILSQGKSLYDVQKMLMQYPGISDFVGPQFAMDLNYSGWLKLPHADFCVAGPGAEKGVQDCFEAHAGRYTEVIKAVWTWQDECSQLVVVYPVPMLEGRRPSAQNVQNFFCEFQKFHRNTANSYVVPSGTLRPLEAPLLPPWWANKEPEPKK